MKHFLLFFIIFPLLIIGCGGNEKLLGLNDKQSDRSNRRNANKQDPSYLRFKFDKTEQKIKYKKPLIIVSVDTTHSMKGWLSNVEHTFQGFTKALSPFGDWKVIFVRADGNGFFSSDGDPLTLEHEDYVLLKDTVLTPKMKYSDAIFLDTLGTHNEEWIKLLEGIDKKCLRSPGCQWLWNERPLLSLKTALMRNKNLINQADVVITIMISDSDESKTSATDVKTAFQKTYKNKKWINYGIIMKEGDSKCLSQQTSLATEGIYSVKIAKMAQETGGTNFGFCEKSYLPLAQKIVSDLSK